MKTEKIMVQELEFGLSRLDGESIPNVKNEQKLIVIKGSESRKKARIFLVILLVFSAFFSIITRYGEMTKLNYEISDLKENLITQNAINSALSVSLEKKNNIMAGKSVSIIKAATSLVRSFAPITLRFLS